MHLTPQTLEHSEFSLFQLLQINFTRKQWGIHIPRAYINGHVTATDKRADHCWIWRKKQKNNNTSWYHWVTDADQSTCCSAAALQSTIVPHPLCLGFNSPDRHCDISPQIDVQQHMETCGLHVYHGDHIVWKIGTDGLPQWEPGTHRDYFFFRSSWSLEVN